MALSVTTTGGAVQLTGNPIYIDCTAGVAGGGITNHKLLCKVSCTDGSIPNGPWILELPVIYGAAKFDIHQYVDTIFTYQFDPESTEKVTSYATLAANIKCEVAETYFDNTGALVETAYAAESLTLYVIKGKLTTYERAWLFENSQTFYSYYVEYTKMLTNMPPDTEILVNSRHNMWFMAPATEAVVYTLTFTYAAEAGPEEEEVTLAGNVTQTRLYQINCDPADWGKLWVRASDDAKLQSILVEVEGVITSKSFSLQVTHEYFDVVNPIYFVNRLSGVDLFSCTGPLIETVVADGETYTQPVPINPTIKLPTTIGERKKTTNRFKCDTGLLPQSMRYWAVEMLESQQLWWLTSRFNVFDARFDVNTVGNYIPITILPGSYDIVSTETDLISITFEFEIAL